MGRKPTLDALGNPIPLGLIENQKQFYRPENTRSINPETPKEPEEEKQ
jgi:hypothetical protein